MTDKSALEAARRQAIWGLILTATAILSTMAILYITLYPFEARADAASREVVPLLLASLYSRPKRFDVFVNLVLYIPLGFALAWLRLRAVAAISAFVMVVACGFCLSFAIETAQVFIRWRTPSLLDVAFNTVGAAFGALVAYALSPHSVERST